MAQRGRPPLPRGVFAFEAPEWEPSEAVVLDTNVVTEALLPNQPEHAECRNVGLSFDLEFWGFRGFESSRVMAAVCGVGARGLGV